MKNRLVLLLCAGFLAAVLPAAAAPAPRSLKHGHPGGTFVAKDGHFLLNGKPFRVISGEMHYQRIPRAYWRLRLRMAKAMGLNTITTYVFWNAHEPKPGVYDFSGNHDVAEFIREAQEEGLYVNLRPGPYSCAEWDFGGFPSWLLRDPTMQVRSRDPKFIAAATRWMDRLGKELAPLQIGNGGPILMVQVENEYGSFGKDHGYMEQIRKMILHAGFTKAQLYTADGYKQLANGALPEIPAFVNYGPGNAKAAYAALRKFRPGQVLMTSEYWDGWFDHWGGKHAQTDAQQQADELAWMLGQGASVSIYMFHGGTSFGWMSGANLDGQTYGSDVTSYDYDSALNESGRTTPKYFLFRDAIAKATGITPPPAPEMPPTMKVAAFPVTESASLWSNLPKPMESRDPRSMEEIGQSYGYVLYRTTLRKAASGRLLLPQVHDYARVYLDGQLAGTIDRRLNQNSLSLPGARAGERLDILVENMGRVNFGPGLNDDRAGIVGTVTLADQPVTGWKIYSLPMKAPWEKKFLSGEKCAGPCFYRAIFHTDKTDDTFLETPDFVKGEVWLNGHALGRYWNIGPQKTLYVPGPWLKKGENEVVIFDIDGEPGRKLEGLDSPIL